MAIVALNTATSPDPVTFTLAGTGISDGSVATPYLTDATSDTARQPGITVPPGGVQYDIARPLDGQLGAAGARREHALAGQAAAAGGLGLRPPAAAPSAAPAVRATYQGCARPGRRPAGGGYRARADWRTTRSVCNVMWVAST